LLLFTQYHQNAILYAVSPLSDTNRGVLA